MSRRQIPGHLFYIFKDYFNFEYNIIEGITISICLYASYIEHYYKILHIDYISKVKKLFLIPRRVVSVIQDSQCLKRSKFQYFQARYKLCLAKLESQPPSGCRKTPYKIKLLILNVSSCKMNMHPRSM